VFINCNQCAGKCTDRLTITPHLLRTKCGLTENNYFWKKNLPAGRRRASTVCSIILVMKTCERCTYSCHLRLAPNAGMNEEPAVQPWSQLASLLNIVKIVLHVLLSWPSPSVKPPPALTYSASIPARRSQQLRFSSPWARAGD